MEITDFLIIGGGIAGLICATELKAAGKSIWIVDKGRGPGGRMSTRRMLGGRLDHGAQYFTVRDECFRTYVDRWLSARIIREWFCHLPCDTNSDGYPRYCGVSGMSDIPKLLAEGLSISLSEEVIELIRDVDCWVAKTASGKAFSGKHLIMTAPLPQSLALLNSTGLDYAGDQQEALSKIQYEKGLATLLVLDGPSGLNVPGGLKVADGPLTWIGDNQQKGISPNVPTITLHANSAFADLHWDSPNELRGPLMIEAAASYLNANIIEYNCHRWGFTIAKKSWPEKSFHNPELKLTLAGDAFGGPRVEGAALSGMNAARNILKI